MDPQIQPQELECLLENEVKKETENRYYISLQFGYGYLKNEDGMRNTVSDWKRQADHICKEQRGLFMMMYNADFLIAAVVILLLVLRNFRIRKRAEDLNSRVFLFLQLLGSWM